MNAYGSTAKFRRYFEGQEPSTVSGLVRANVADDK